MDFAKMFQTELGQVVVMLQTDDDGAPEVRVFMRPEDMDVCSTAFGYSGDDEGQAKAEDGFAKFDMAMATACLREVNSLLGIEKQKES